MLKEFAQYLVSLKDNKTYNIHGDTYSDHDLVRIKPHIDRPANLSVSGLDSIVKLVRNELDMFENLPVFIRVDDARTVSVFTTYDDMMCRDSLYTAKCDVPGFRDGFREYEQAIIELRSKFSPGPGVDYLLDLLSLKALVQVKPRVALRPFRTFLEVEQPVSEFLLRLDDDGNVGLFEADGGMWQQTAKASIAAYFEDKLAQEVKDGKIVVMM